MSRSATVCCWPRATAQACPRKSSASGRAWRRRCRSRSLDGLGPGSAALFRLAPDTGAGRRHPGGRRTAGSVACWTRWAAPLDGHGPLPAGRAAAPRAGRAARCDAARAAGPAAGRRRARAQLLRHLPPGPAARPVLRLRHRQVDPARHAGAPHRLRRRGAGPGRRARTRGAGVPRGRSGSRRAGALRGRGRHVGFAAAAAPPGRLSPR